MTNGPVDVEAIVIDYLNANLTATTAAGSFPARIPRAFVKVGRAGSAFVDRHSARLERVRIDLDARGGGRPASFDVASAAVAALLALNDTPYAHAAGVVTAVEVELGPTHSPDPETDAERYIATVAVFAHRKAAP